MSTPVDTIGSLCIGPARPFSLGAMAAIGTFALRRLNWTDTSLARFFVATPDARQDGSEPRKLFTWLYPMPVIEQVSASPYWHLAKGYFWNLACTGLAAATFYQTVSFSSLAAMERLLPFRLPKAGTVQVACTLSLSVPQQAGGSLALSTHMLVLAPVMAKTIHIALETFCLYTKGRYGSAESWRETARKVSTRIEMAWFARFALVSCANTARPTITLGLAVLQLALAAVTGGGSCMPYMKALVMPSCFLTGMGAAIGALEWSDSAQLGNALPLLRDIDSFSHWHSPEEWDVLQSCQDRLITHTIMGQQRQCKEVLKEKVTTWLQDALYQPLCAGNFSYLAADESALRTIYSVGGKTKTIYHDDKNFQLECIRFSLMLFLANLTRLQDKFENGALTQEQYDKAQDVLYLQVIQSIQGKILRQDEVCFGVGEMIDNLCRKLYIPKDKICTDPFFDSLRHMLGQLSVEGLVGRSHEIGWLTLSLSLCIDTVDGMRALGTRMCEADKQQESKSGGSYKIAQQLSAIPDLATWSLDQIITKVQAGEL